jgi:GTP-binding protein Era
MPDVAAFRSGFVSIVGRPNAGKSTLLNALVGGKLAIVSEKPQTTRSSVEGVVNLEGAQIIFLDTPGIHESTSLLNKRMMDAVRSALEDRDVVLYLGDALAPFTDDDVKAVSAIRNLSKPAFLLLTKIDKLVDKRMLLPRIEEYKAVREFDEYFPISSVKGTGLDQLRDAIVKRLPESPAYFPPDYITDQPERFLGAELIRERILRETRQEVPHSVAVVIDEWKDTPRLLRIMATIYVERPGQKAIVIGAKGATLKKIGTLARHEMETMFSRKIFLEMFVKVQKDWRENPEFLNSIDWRSMRGRELE